MNAPISSPMQQQASSFASSSSLSSSTHQSPTSIVPPPPPQELKAPSTDAFLKDFTLIAEAAKRAQLAVMMRDFESCGIS